ncbi:MAG: preprotein translocase subunit SecG [Parvibaculaceae bacterium]
MVEVLLVIHLLIALALIGVVLLQRSEGGALGIGGGGGAFSSRGVGSTLTRATAILAVIFFMTSIALTLVARSNRTPGSIFDSTPQQGQQQAPAGQQQTPQQGESVLPQLPGSEQPAPTGPQVPTGQ